MSVYYPLWNSKNEKTHSSIMMGKGRERNHISFAIMIVCSHLWTWHLSAFHSVNWVFIFLPSRSMFMSHFNPLIHPKNASYFHCVWLLPDWFNDSMSLVMSLYVQSNSSIGTNICSHYAFHCVGHPYKSLSCLPLHLCVSLHSFHLPTYINFPCQFCVDDVGLWIHHGPPSTSLFMSTSAHHPRTRLRN